MPGPPQWESAIKSYLAAMQAAGVGNSARMQRSMYLSRLQTWCGDCGPWDTTADQISDFLRQSVGNRVSRKTAADAIRSFYTWGQQHGWIQDNPASSADR
jgi:site-specific recombinase XerD